MTRVTSSWSQKLLVFTLLSACDGFGRPVVGEVSGFSGQTACRTEVPACTSPQPPAAVITPDAVDPFSPPLCTPGARVVRLASSDEPTPPQLSCDAVVLALRADLDSSRALPAQMRGVELHLRAELPTTFALSASHLESSRVIVEGPVAFTIRDASVLRNVRIELEHPAASLRLIDVDALDLGVEAPVNVIDIARSLLTRVKIRAAEVVVDTTSIESLAVAASRFVAARVEGANLTLQAGVSQIVANDLEQFTVQRCDALLIASSTIDRSRIAACREPLRIQNSTIKASTVDGNIESIESSWFENVLGGSTASSLELWRADAFRENVLCANVSRLALASTDTAVCNACEALEERATQAVCGVKAVAHPTNLGNAEYDVANPRCPALDRPALCDPLPIDRSRI